MDTIRMQIDGFETPMRADATILEASYETYGSEHWGVRVPTLNYLKGLCDVDKSGVCVVEVEGMGVVNASTTQVADGMSVSTKSPAVFEAQIAAVKPILDAHDQDCTNCHRSGNCELQDVTYRLNLRKPAGERTNKVLPIDESCVVVRDSNKCFACGRCVATCERVQTVNAIEMKDGKVAYVGGDNLAETSCIKCGQCVAACPVGALYERDDVMKVVEALQDPAKTVVVQTAPSVRAALGEELDYAIGAQVEGRIPAALRELGFDYVFDTKFGADLTIMEEAAEFIDRLSNGGVLPMTTSCCPGWINFAETQFPELLPNVSSCKSPQAMFGAAVKTYLSEQKGIAKDDIVVVSVMPCIAKKDESARAQLAGNVDYSITTRELARMIKFAGIRFDAVAHSEYDSPMGIGSGAGAIFGVTGGVMEAALRTAADWLSGESLGEVNYTAVRGTQGVKEAEVQIAGQTIKVAVASGLGNARTLLDKIKAGEADYQFVEIMACPGGCVNGGGQPFQKASVKATVDLASERGGALYSIDERAVIRKSHDNPEIKAFYERYVGEPGSEVAHGLFHTEFNAR